jgi:anti-sigma regulatory factor (Ser/Thr protein kinase)
MQTRFVRDMNALPAVFAATEEFCVRHDVAPDARNAIALVVEELFTNAVKYGVRQRDQLEVRMECRDGDFELALTDFDADEFDVTQRPEVDVDRPLEERTPGGLGIHLMRHLVDRIEYDYRDRRSTITVHKKVG